MAAKHRTLHLKQRGGVYWLKLAIPRALRTRYLTKSGKPRTHVEESLHTGDLDEANRRKHARIAYWQVQFASTRHAHAGREGGDAESPGTWRREIRAALAAGDDDGAEIMGGLAIDEAERIAARAGTEEAKRWAALATTTAPTLNEAFDDWLGVSDFNAATQGKYRAALREFLAFLEADDETPQRVNDAMARAYVRWLNDEATTPGGEKLSKAAKQSRMNALSGLWRHLERTGGAPRGSNPWLDHKLTDRKRAPKRRYTDDELLAFVNGPEVRGGDATHYPKRTLVELFALGLYTGARLNELCERKLGDVEPIRGGYNLHIRKAKTKAGERVLPIVHPIPVAILKRRIGKRTAPDAQLFAEFIPGGPMQQLSWHAQKALGRYRDKVGLPAEVDFHSTRRQFASQAELLGIDPLAAERYFGHKPAGLMRGLYAKGSDEAMRKVANAITYPPKVETAIRRALGIAG